MRRAPALVRLVRLPAVLTVPGDVLLGAAWGGEGEESMAAARLALGSSLLYLAGMALNDWADRERDARERPRRPIPAGEVSPAMALGSAIALTGGALAVTGGVGSAGSTRSLRAASLAATVWLYDLAAKDTPAGPWTMALARALDVLMGAGRNGDSRQGRVSPGFGRGLRRAGPPAAVVGAHTLLVTLVSAREVEGADSALARRALLGVVATGVAAATLILASPRRAVGPRSAGTSALALACLALYGCAMGRAGAGALRAPDPARLQRLVATGVLANMPLQAALLAARGRRTTAAALMVGWPAARWAGRRAAVT
jgi:4-hydroxybenzoate polyprenyltransferase